jgi:hypothetical protein
MQVGATRTNATHLNSSNSIRITGNLPWSLPYSAQTLAELDRFPFAGKYTGVVVRIAKRRLSCESTARSGSRVCPVRP